MEFAFQRQRDHRLSDHHNILRLFQIVEPPWVSNQRHKHGRGERAPGSRNAEDREVVRWEMRP